MGQQGLSDFRYPQTTKLYRRNDVDGKEVKMAENEFDLAKFNKEFEEKKKINNERNTELEQQRLQFMNQEIKEKKAYNSTIQEYAIGIKDTWFGIYDDLMQKDFSINVFNRDDRLFYVGLTIVIIVILVYILELFTSSDSQHDSNKYEIHHVYHK